MGVSTAKPVVVAYRKDWPERAARLIAMLEDALGVFVHRIEHIGSTAIPGMSAKDVLDLQASVADLGLAAPRFDSLLAAIGFRRSPYELDHVPAGRADEPERWAKRLWLRRAHPGGDVNLHVRRTGSPNERLALLFRDWFRAHPDAVPSYAAFKMTLAETAPDVDTYTYAKDPVVDLVIVVAEEWATAQGWTP
jgi:GrpB-like predicted nucleotidyltransferase (UPF0157 family)